MSNEIWDRVNEMVDISILLTRHGVNLSSNGKRGNPCPICGYTSPSRPSLQVFAGENACYCHHCKIKFDIFGLVMAKEHLEDRWEALRTLAKEVGVSDMLSPAVREEMDSREKLSEALQEFAGHFNSSMEPAATVYLKNRGILDDFIAAMKIGYIPKEATFSSPKAGVNEMLREVGLVIAGGKINPSWCDRIFVPFWKNGRICYFAGRSIDPDSKMPQILPANEKLKIPSKPTIGTPFGKEVLVVEGLFDFLTARQNQESVIGILGQSPVFDVPDKIKEINLCFDWDAIGEEYLVKFGLHFLAQKKEVFVYPRPENLPEGKKDLNDFICAGNQIADMKKIPLQDYLIDKIASDRKKYLPIVFKAIACLGPMNKEEAIKKVSEVTGINVRAIKEEYNSYSGNHKNDSQQNNSYLDPDSNIEFLIDDQNYSMDVNGLFHKKGNKFLTRKPFFVTGILKDPITNEYYVNLVSYKNSKRIAKIVSQKDISDKKLLANLSQFGFPVTTQTSGEAVAFLNDLIYRNESLIPVGLASSQLGWQEKRFLFPESALQEDGSEIPVHFVHAEPSARMFGSKGDKETYLNFIRGLKKDLPRNYIIPIFVIYATFASFLLKPMDSPNLVINFCFESGEGKTTILKLCGSIFGDPEKCYVTWDATETFIGRWAAILNGIPLLINESSSKASVKKGELSKIVYMLSEGRTRGKANPDSGMSTAPILNFHTVTFSCGEISLLADSDLVGAQIRLVEFETAFGVIDIDFIQKLENVIKDNYGLLAKEFIKKVMETDLSKFKLFRTIDSNNCTPKQKLKINHLNRKIKQLQPVFVAGRIAEAIFNFGYDPLEIVGKVYDDIETQILKNIGTVDQFIPWLHDFVAQHPDRFPAEIELLSGSKRYSGPVWGVTRDLDLLILKSAFDADIMHAYNTSDGKLSRTIMHELYKKKIIEGDRQGNKTINIRGARHIVFKNFFKDSESKSDIF